MKMPKKRGYTKAVLVLAVAGIIMLSVFTLPSGTSNDILSTKKDGTELLTNPTLANNCSNWDFGSWRFVSQSWTPSTWNFEEGKVTMTLQGYDRSFYCINIAQHTDIKIYDRQYDYIITWKGAVHEAETLPSGALGVGVNLWLDVIKDSQTQEVLELYVFFYQQGFYTIPVGSYKDYGYRGSYWFEAISDTPSEETWRFFYFHPIQLKLGKTTEVTFSLNQCLETVRQNAGETYKNADSFHLTRIDSVMEMIMAKGTFTTETLSLKLVN